MIREKRHHRSRDDDGTDDDNTDDDGEGVDDDDDAVVWGVMDMRRRIFGSLFLATRNCVCVYNDVHMRSTTMCAR